jgi:gentisate 1,2-dioxygenase
LRWRECASDASAALSETATLDFAPHDVFTVPSWIPWRIETDGEGVLFSCSDRGPQEMLGLFREDDPSNAAGRG